MACFKAIVKNGRFGTDHYYTTRNTVEEAKIWLQFIIDTKAVPSTAYVTLQLAHFNASHQVDSWNAIVTVNNPIAYVKEHGKCLKN
jgi:hypothetical protein